MIQAAKMREASEAAESTVQATAQRRVEAFQVGLFSLYSIRAAAESVIRTPWYIPYPGSYAFKRFSIPLDQPTMSILLLGT